MNSILSIINSLNADSSRNAKLDILRQNSGNTLLKQVFYLGLNPLINFYQRKIPQYESTGASTLSLQHCLDCLDKLSSREITGNAAIAYLGNMLASLDPDDAEVLKLVIQKDLKCGVARATVNAVWPDLIPEYPVMLCAQFDQKLVDKISWPASVQLKMDGMRFNAIVNSGKCEFRSRNGKELNLLGYLEDEFIALAAGQNVVFDGELLVQQADSCLADRQTGNGILNKAVKGTISDSEAAQVVATVWDLIPYECFVFGRDITPYQTRFDRLESMTLPAKIRLVTNHLVNSYEDAQKIFQDYLEQGQEGIILKDLNGPWENKRAKHQIKFKAELECDLKIVGVQMGTGKYQGLLGAIICQSQDGVLEVNVGSGFTDDQRKDLCHEKLIGKVVSVKYNARIENRQGDRSLFLPVFVEIREDKSVADLSKDIK